MEALLDIDFDRVPGWDEFIKLHQSLQGFEEGSEHFDPRRSNEILNDFKSLISPHDYNQVVRDFKQ